MTPPDPGTVAIVVAHHAEIAHLVKAFEGVTTVTDGPWTEYHFHVGRLPIVVIRGGVGSVSCAAATEHVIGRHNPTHIVNYGSAGSQVRDILPGDVVIGEKVVAYSSLQILPNGEELFIQSQFTVNGEEQQIVGSSVTCCPRLVLIARERALGWTPDPWPIRSSLAYQPLRSPMIRSGTVISGDSWIQSIDRIDQLHQRHDSLVADMEAAAIGQVAELHEIPFLVVKDVSNNEFYLPANVWLGQVNMPGDEIGKRAAILVRRVLDTLASEELVFQSP